MTKEELEGIKIELIEIEGLYKETAKIIKQSENFHHEKKLDIESIKALLIKCKKSYKVKIIKHSKSFNDSDYIETAFFSSIQIWCKNIKSSIRDFENEILSQEKNQTGVTFSFTLLRQIIGRIAGRYKLITNIGLRLFQEVITYLNEKKSKEDTIKLKEIVNAWNEKVDTFQNNISEHKRMYYAFIKHHKNSTEKSLLQEIKNLPKGRKSGLPNANDIKKAMLELWIKNLADDSLWDWDHGNLLSGFIYIKIEYSIALLEESGISGAILKESEIDDLYNEKALNLLKRLWAGKKITDTPFDIELEININETDVNIIGQRINNQWSIFKHNMLKDAEAIEAFNIVKNGHIWDMYKVDLLTIDK